MGGRNGHSFDTEPMAPALQKYQNSEEEEEGGDYGEEDERDCDKEVRNYSD